MSLRAASGAFLVATAIASILGLGACARERVTRRRPPGRDALAVLDPRAIAELSAPRLPPPTAAERAWDTERKAPLLGVVEELEGAFRELTALARKGAAEPAFREAWPARRAVYLARVGRIRSRILEVDALGRRSHGARVASRLLGFLEVQLPNAAEESWSSRPGGALGTWSADFSLICSGLRRYVETLDEPTRKGPSHDHPTEPRRPAPR